MVPVDYLMRRERVVHQLAKLAKKFCEKLAIHFP